MSFIEIIQILSITFGGAFALYQYYRQNKFERLKNINNIWRKFYETESFVSLFDLLDKIDNYKNPEDINSLKILSSKEKLKYLAFLEEVSGYMEFSNEDKKHLIYLFQWHFYYLFQNENTYLPFWSNLSEEDTPTEIEKVIKASYWNKLYTFSKQCKQELLKAGYIN